MLKKNSQMLIRYCKLFKMIRKRKKRKNQRKVNIDHTIVLLICKLKKQILIFVFLFKNYF